MKVNDSIGTDEGKAFRYYFRKAICDAADELIAAGKNPFFDDALQIVADKNGWRFDDLIQISHLSMRGAKVKHMVHTQPYYDQLKAKNSTKNLRAPMFSKGWEPK